MTANKLERLRLWRRLAVMSYLLLMVDVLVWETWGAPPERISIYFGLAMKFLPLLLAFLPIWRGNTQVYMWISLLMLLYIVEGLVLSYSEYQYGWGPHQELIYAATELAASAAFVFFAGSYIRLKNPRIPKFRKS